MEMHPTEIVSVHSCNRNTVLSIRNNSGYTEINLKELELDVLFPGNLNKGNALHSLKQDGSLSTSLPLTSVTWVQASQLHILYHRCMHICDLNLLTHNHLLKSKFELAELDFFFVKMLIFISNFQMGDISLKKGKAIPVTGCGGP
jgi:hypothetical protein